MSSSWRFVEMLPLTNKEVEFTTDNVFCLSDTIVILVRDKEHKEHHIEGRFEVYLIEKLDQGQFRYCCREITDGA